MGGFGEVKRQSLERRKKDLIEEYEAVVGQMGTETDDATLLRQQRKLESLEAEITSIEAKLRALSSYLGTESSEKPVEEQGPSQDIKAPQLSTPDQKKNWVSTFKELFFQKIEEILMHNPLYTPKHTREDTDRNPLAILYFSGQAAEVEQLWDEIGALYNRLPAHCGDMQICQQLLAKIRDILATAERTRSLVGEALLEDPDYELGKNLEFALRNTVNQGEKTRQELIRVAGTPAASGKIKGELLKLDSFLAFLVQKLLEANAYLSVYIRQ